MRESEHGRGFGVRLSLLRSALQRSTKASLRVTLVLNVTSPQKSEEDPRVIHTGHLFNLKKKKFLKSKFVSSLHNLYPFCNSLHILSMLSFFCSISVFLNKEESLHTGTLHGLPSSSLSLASTLSTTRRRSHPHPPRSQSTHHPLERTNLDP